MTRLKIKIKIKKCKIKIKNVLKINDLNAVTVIMVFKNPSFTRRFELSFFFIVILVHAIKCKTVKIKTTIT